MADLLRCVRDEIAPMLARNAAHRLLGRTTISAGTVNGGSKINIVPDLCRAEVDIRYLPGEAPLDPVSRKLSEVCADVEIEHVNSPPTLTDEGHPLIGVLKQLGSRCVGAPWFSDAGIFAHRGMPAIALGPGSIAQAHTRDEWIAVEDLEKGAAFFREFLLRV
jgi:acetylornithine deacetylase/succinyl-diaminopimelate desuccinylase-like protein